MRQTKEDFEKNANLNKDQRNKKARMEKRLNSDQT